MVCLSGFEPLDMARWSKLVRARGGKVEESISSIRECTHFVVPKPLKRTVKLCAAMSVLPNAIVDEEWLRACEQAGKFVDVTPYLFHGAMASNPKTPKIKWSFDAVRRRFLAASRCHVHGHGARSCYALGAITLGLGLPRTLASAHTAVTPRLPAQTVSRERALAGGCFAGRRFFVTKGCSRPKPSDLAIIITNAGGAVVTGRGPPPAGTVVVSCEEVRRRR